jgi:hypothetical protein
MLLNILQNNSLQLKIINLIEYVNYSRKIESNNVIKLSFYI